MGSLIWDINNWDANEWDYLGSVTGILNNMIDVLPHWWSKKERESPGSNTYELLWSYSQEFTIYSDNAQLMKSELYVDSASSIYLEQLGNLYLLKRRSLETDDQLRGRIKSFRNTFTGGGTNSAIVASIADEFNGTTVTVADELGGTWCKARVTIDWSDWYDNIQGRENDYFNLLNNVKAAGVWLKTTILFSPPVFQESIHMADIFQPHPYLRIEGDTISHSEDYRFAGFFQLESDLVWDDGYWDNDNWRGGVFETRVESFKIAGSTRTEDTTSRFETVKESTGLRLSTDSATMYDSSLTVMIYNQANPLDYAVSGEVVKFGTGLTSDTDTFFGTFEDYKFAQTLTVDEDTVSSLDIPLYFVQEKIINDIEVVEETEPLGSKSTIFDIAGANWVSQSFTASENYRLRLLQIYAMRIGGPAGNFVYSIFDANAQDRPIAGTEQGLSSIPALSLSPTMVLNDLIFATPLNLVAGQNYAFVLRLPTGTSVRIVHDIRSGDGGRVRQSSDSGSTWETLGGANDCMGFITHGTNGFIHSDNVTFGASKEIVFNTISHTDMVSESLFLNIPATNVIALWDDLYWDDDIWSEPEEISHNETLTLEAPKSISDSNTTTEAIDLAYEMFWDDGYWTQGLWNI